MATNNINSRVDKFDKSQKQTLQAYNIHAQSIFDVINELEEKGCATKPLIMECPMKELRKILKETNPARVIEKKEDYVENKTDW